MIDYTSDERFDGLYMNVVQTTKGVEPLLDTMFSFLRRKTEFFDGPPRPEYRGSERNLQDGRTMAVKTVQHVLQKHANLYVQDLQAKKKKEQAAKKKKEELALKKKKKAEEEEAAKKKKKEEEEAAKKSSKEGGEANVVEMGNDGGFDLSGGATGEAKDDEKQQSQRNASTSREAPDGNENAGDGPGKDDDGDKSKDGSAENDDETTTKKKNDGGDGDENGDDDKPKGPPPPGNGGTVEGKYVWTQTLSELSVHVPVPDGTRGKDLNVAIARNHLRVGLRRGGGPSWIIDAPLTKSVICDDSFWMVEDGNRLILTLQKLNQMEWWDSVVQGDPKIDVRAIQPEDSSLSDLDGETRRTVEKMMYDQRQKALGLPTSEDERKMKMLETFKAHHPEMDFSNATIS